MKYISKQYIKHLERLTTRIDHLITKRIEIGLMKQSALSSLEPIIDNNNSPRIILSLTSFGKRIQYVYLVLESIAKQTIKANEVILWLSENEFRNNIPQSLRYFEKRGLQINFCSDIGPYTKLVYALKNYPNCIIITIDDDMIYPFDMIEQLIYTYKKNPQTICCNVGRKIMLDKQNKILPYNKWERLFSETETSIRILPLGVNGVLYFPGCFDIEVTNVEKFMSLAPHADDIWFKLMSLKKQVSCTITGAYPDTFSSFISLDSSFIQPLANNNILNNKNDSQFYAIMQEYKIIFT